MGAGRARGAMAAGRRRGDARRDPAAKRLRHRRHGQVGTRRSRRPRAPQPAGLRPLLRLPVPAGGAQLLPDTPVAQRRQGHAGGQRVVLRPPESRRASRRLRRLRPLPGHHLRAGPDRRRGAAVHSRQRGAPLLSLLPHRRSARGHTGAGGFAGRIRGRLSGDPLPRRSELPPPPDAARRLRRHDHAHGRQRRAGARSRRRARPRRQHHRHVQQRQRTHLGGGIRPGVLRRQR